MSSEIKKHYYFHKSDSIEGAASSRLGFTVVKVRSNLLERFGHLFSCFLDLRSVARRELLALAEHIVLGTMTHDRKAQIGKASRTLKPTTTTVDTTVVSGVTL